MKKFVIVMIVIGLAATFAVAQKKPKRTMAQLYSEATSARPDGKDFVFYIKGSAYAFIPGERPQKLFGVDGYNIRRRVETPEKDGFFLSTKEIVFYTDAKTGEIISEWTNPWTKEKLEVFHIQNDPVNGRTRLKDGKYIGVSIDGTREFGESGPPEEIGNRWGAMMTGDLYNLQNHAEEALAQKKSVFIVEAQRAEIYINSRTAPFLFSKTTRRYAKWL